MLHIARMQSVTDPEDRIELERLHEGYLDTIMKEVAKEARKSLLNFTSHFII